ncbi:MAG: hypothetical protein ABW252_26055 [Polyangiales bacterium]
MRVRILGGAWLALALVGGAACSDDPPFLGLNQLCAARASDLCDARAGCCAPEDEAACMQRETAACELVKQRLEAETLTYDAVAAARLRGTQRSALDACGPVPALSALFTGARALGTPCERAAQCESDSCDGQPLTCVPRTPRALCDAP